MEPPVGGDLDQHLEIGYCTEMECDQLAMYLGSCACSCMQNNGIPIVYSYHLSKTKRDKIIEKAGH